MNVHSDPLASSVLPRSPLTRFRIVHTSLRWNRAVTEMRAGAESPASISNDVPSSPAPSRAYRLSPSTTRAPSSSVMSATETPTSTRTAGDAVEDDETESEDEETESEETE